LAAVAGLLASGCATPELQRHHCRPPHSADRRRVDLRGRDPYVRTTSSKAVERLGAAEPKPVAVELASELLDERQEVRREAAMLFWRLGPLAADAVPERPDRAAGARRAAM